MELPKFADDDKNNNNVKNQKTETNKPAKSGKGTNIKNTNEEEIKKKASDVHKEKEVSNPKSEKEEENTLKKEEEDTLKKEEEDNTEVQSKRNSSNGKKVDKIVKEEEEEEEEKKNNGETPDNSTDKTNKTNKTNNIIEQENKIANIEIKSKSLQNNLNICLSLSTTNLYAWFSEFNRKTVIPLKYSAYDYINPKIELLMHTLSNNSKSIYTYNGFAQQKNCSNLMYQDSQGIDFNRKVNLVSLIELFCNVYNIRSWKLSHYNEFESRFDGNDLEMLEIFVSENGTNITNDITTKKPPKFGKVVDTYELIWAIRKGEDQSQNDKCAIIKNPKVDRYYYTSEKDTEFSEEDNFNAYLLAYKAILK